MVSCKSYPSTFTLTLNIRVGDSLLFSWTAGNTLCCGRCVCQGPLTYWISVCFLQALPQTSHALKRPGQGVRNSKKEVADRGAHTANAVCFCRAFFILTSPGSTQDVRVSLLSPCRQTKLICKRYQQRGSVFFWTCSAHTAGSGKDRHSFFKCSAASIPRLKDKQETTHAYCMCECVGPMSLPVWLVFVCSRRSFYRHMRWPDFEPQGFAFPLQRGFARLKMCLWLIVCLSWVAVSGAAVNILL